MLINDYLKPYDNVIWDWNGTLLDDSWLCVDIINKILADQNYGKLDIDLYREVFGFPISDYYKKIGIDHERESYDELSARFISIYLANVHNCKLQNGAIAILSELKNKDIKQFILTAAHKESVLKLLAYYSIEQLFEKIEGLDNHRAESKLDKGYYLIENNSIAVDKTVLIGDTIHDLEVANQLGVNCILIANGHQSKSRLSKKACSGVRILNNLLDF